MFLVGVYVRTHMNIRLAHVLVDDYVSQVISGRESSLWNITRLDLYLMVARTKINLRENLGSSKLIKQDINAGKRILVFNSDRIEWSIINT